MESATCTVDDGQTMCLINPVKKKQKMKKQKIHMRPVSTPCLIDHDLDDMIKEESPTPSPPPMLLPELTHRPTLGRCPAVTGTPVSPSIMTHSDIVDNYFNMMELGHYTSTPVETPDPEYSPLDYGFDYSERLNDFFSPSYPVSMVDESDDDRDLNVDFIDDLQTGSMTLSGFGSMSSSLPLFDLVMSLDQTEEDILMAKYGYTFKFKLRDTTQGQVWMAKTKAGDVVAVKKVERALHEKHESKEDEGMTYLVETDIVREADVLKTLNADSDLKKNGGIVRYLDFIESGTFLYLVTEYVNGVSLDELIEEAHRYIEEGRMRHCHWVPVVKDIMSQIITVINRLHTVHQCCHQNLFTENFKVSGISFDEHDDGSVTIKGDAEVTLLDFGVAQIFDALPVTHQQPARSLFTKETPSIFRKIQHCPESIVGDEYDASSSDMWSLGMILYEAMVGEPLFQNIDDDAYDAVQDGKLHSYMVQEKLLRLFQLQSFSLLEGLLDTAPETRLTSTKAEQHRWFN